MSGRDGEKMASMTTRRQTPWRLRYWASSLLAALSASFPAWPLAEETAVPEQQIKAAYILNFTRYASWPGAALADPRAPLVICLMGQGASDIARQLQNRAAGGRPLELRTPARIEDTGECHALYLGQSERQRQSALLARLRDQAVLTIGDSSSFLADGGIINMMLVEGSIRFEVNLAAAKRSGMSLNPRVLALADRVLGGATK